MHSMSQRVQGWARIPATPGGWLAHVLPPWPGAGPRGGGGVTPGRRGGIPVATSPALPWLHTALRPALAGLPIEGKPRQDPMRAGGAWRPAGFSF